MVNTANVNLDSDGTIEHFYVIPSVILMLKYGMENSVSVKKD